MIDLRHNINGGGNAPPTFWRNKMQQGTNKTNRDRFVTSYGKDANYSHNDNRRCAIWFEKNLITVYTQEATGLQKLSANEQNADLQSLTDWNYCLIQLSYL
jgi:hypothetical protein